MNSEDAPESLSMLDENDTTNDFTNDSTNNPLKPFDSQPRSASDLTHAAASTLQDEDSFRVVFEQASSSGSSNGSTDEVITESDDESDGGIVFKVSNDISITF